MATDERLYEALRKADAAGDVEAARRLSNFIKQKQRTPASQINEPEVRADKGFFERFGEDVQQRLETQQRIRQQRPDIPVVGRVIGGLREAGEVGAGTILDLGGELAVSGFRALPDYVEQPIRRGASAVGRTIAEYTPLDELAKLGIEVFNRFDEKNPNTAGLLKSGVNIAQLALPAKVKPTKINPTTGKRIRVKATPIEEISAGEKQAAAIAPVRQKYKDISAQENKMFNEAKTAGRETTLKASEVAPVKDRIESMLRETGDSLEDEVLKPLASELDKLDKFKSRLEVKDTGVLDEFGRPITKAIELTKDEIKVPQILGIRENISRLAKSPDGKLRNAAGRALSEFDNTLYNLAEDSILSGDDAAIKKALEAIAFSRQKFKDFGTNTRAGQNRLFENIITKNPIDNSQFADVVEAHRSLNAFGRGSASKEATPEFIARLLDNAGGQRDLVRKNLRDGFIYKAIEKSKYAGEAGETLIRPNILLRELNRLLDGSPGAQAIGPIRDVVFSKEDLNVIRQFKNIVQNPSRARGKIRDLATNLPVVGDKITPSNIVAQKSATKQTEKFITELALGIQTESRGRPITYGSLIAAGQGLTED